MTATLEKPSYEKARQHNAAVVERSGYHALLEALMVRHGVNTPKFADEFQRVVREMKAE